MTQLCVVIRVDGKYYSRLFSVDRPFRDILAWAEAMGLFNPQPGEMIIATYTGSSK